MSTVLKRKRGLSDMEFYANAVKLRHAITTLLLRDFGIKDKVRNIDYFAKCEHMTEGDTKTLIELMDKYNIHRITDEYPLWLVDRFDSYTTLKSFDGLFNRLFKKEVRK